MPQPMPADYYHIFEQINEQITCGHFTIITPFFINHSRRKGIFSDFPAFSIRQNIKVEMRTSGIPQDHNDDHQQDSRRLPHQDSGMMNKQ